ncbi:MAG: hypothetical protein A3F84_11760 [Candidatus Handelsmanbacteria bacterium RIFCSPLOWO2_12_FULL_64_10]|uniref:Uroporphyrinogen decarboxylase (URO-D) domain-containing protein n=1 Tax=Handelsmanbacteria sp. (strain RIFCSPLOWO2_12_FULL_64_10) TaxID=1817868 RepID=A0A1F6CBF7_HANXR|nr:MAG: hypothetical protein A3F84_11760 [Candidatus Handelsmanbacteria bacterium RIFCSPLOWO2_12_FULL_64_10]
MGMDWQIPGHERVYLRELARRQAEVAALPVMAKRRQMWYDLNDGRPGARPPVVVETGTFDRDFFPESILRCASKTGRTVERQLLRNLRNHELMDDDKVMPDTFDIGWFVEIDELGVKIGRETVQDAQGVETGYRFLHPIQDLKRDFHLLKPATCRVDRERTTAWKAFLEGLLGDLLPVEVRTGVFGCAMLTHRVVELMGMEAFFLAMYDEPDEVHRLMAFLRDNALRVMRWAEAEGLLRANSGNQVSFGSSFNFTTGLPAPQGQPAGLRDMWGCANSQETIGVSPGMYREFCFPYYRDACALMGRLYYGCCEPVHPFWEDIRQLPNLKKVSVPRWCDQRLVGEALRGTDIVFSRKPDPNFLSVDQTLNEEAWAAHIRETLEATRGVQVEFIVRDVYTVHGDLSNARRAVAIARREIDRYYRP